MGKEVDVYLLPSIIFIGGIVVGFLFESILIKRLRKIALKTKWKGDEIIIDSFKGLIFSWSIIAGTYLSIHQLKESESLISIADKVLFSVLVISFSVLAGRILVGLIKFKTSNSDGEMASASIIANITRIAVFLVGILVILQTLGISITPILTALGVGGLAVALALQETLSNLFSGIQVIASQQIKTGDYIKLDSGETGFVTDITWRNTTIRLLSNSLIVIPNSKMASAILTNYNLPEKETSVSIEVGVSYDSDLEQVEKITIQTATEIMQKTEGGVENFQPFIRYHTFADSSISFTVILRAKEFTSQYLIKHEFIKALHKKYKEHSIEIPFPIRTVLLRKAD